MCHTLQFIEHAAVNSNGGGGKTFRIEYHVALVPSRKIWNSRRSTTEHRRGDQGSH